MSTDAPAADGLRRIATPEGVPITVRLAGRGERAGAVLIDLLILGTGGFLLSLLFGLALGWMGLAETAFASFLMVWFLVRSFYFVFFELRWNGVTPGKRVLKLRVTDREGGPLSASAVFARNLMREVELFLPATYLMSGAAGPADAGMKLLTLGWMAVFVLMPFFNRNRLRAGDMVGGTMVIEAPNALLVEDLARRGARNDAAAAYVFTARELAAYGIRELHTLEDVMRRGHPEVMGEVARRIARKIGRPERDAQDARAFLDAYYTALRRTLESKALFGIRRRDKFDDR
ncbi:MAG: RDD family protein [Alphaproteobacteria bacterium]|nr:RDD family protein [Alphaproteobacteria bacterium]